MKRILVCGSRDFFDYEMMDEALKQHWVPGNSILIHGDARGADRMSEEWLRKEFPEDADNVERYPYRSEFGKAGGPIRNQQMLDEGKPDVVIAFPLKKSVGTWDMVEKAEKAGVPVHVIDWVKL